MTTDAATYFDTPESAPVLPRTTASMKAAEIREKRTSALFKKLKADFRARCARERHADGSHGAPCWLCNAAIDYSLEYPHPLSWSLDHAVTVKDRPDMMMDPLNFRAAHIDCNIRRGTDAPALDLGEASEVW